MKFATRELIFAVLLMGIPLASWWLLYRPLNARASGMREQIEEKRLKLQTLHATTRSIGDRMDRIAELEEAMEYFQSKLPSEREIDLVLREVSELAEANGLRVKSIRTRDRDQNTSAGRQRYSEQPIDVVVEGGFMQFYSFLQQLENQPRIMRIQRMLIAEATEGNAYGTGEIRSDFTMMIYFENDGVAGR